MDIIPKFFIFGVPDGFDLLDGTTGYVTYFQKFYISDSKENTRFSIHRDAKGNITYTYLKYNLSSANSRAGSFFGMSLIFQNVYCGDPLSLFKLFDMVYNTYILIDETKEKEGKAIGFIRPIHGNKDIQARYDKITRFQDKRDYIQHYIENVLLANINDNFKNDFYLIDSSFSNEQPDLVVQEPLQSVSNERLLADLRQFNRVAVSPDWVPSTPPPGPNGSTQKQDTAVRTIVLAPEVIGSLLEYTKGYQNYIIDSLNDIAAADIETANDVYKEVAASLKKVKTIPSTDKRVSQIISDYTILVEQLQNLIQKIEEGPTPLPPPPMPWWKNPKILGIMGGSVVIIIVLTIGLIKAHDKLQEEENDRTPYIVQNIRILIEEGNYERALALAGDSLKGNMYRHFADTIQDIQTLKCINDTLSKVPCYSYAWDLSTQLKDNAVKESTQKQLKEACTNYLQQATNNATTKLKARGAKAMINNCKVPIDEAEKKKMINQLDKIINDNLGGSGGRGSGVSVSTKQYRIQICKVERKGAIDFKWQDNPDLKTYQKDATLNGQYFYYRLIESSDGRQWTECDYNIAEPHISASNSKLKEHGGTKCEYKIIKQSGTITVKDGNKNLFTITIKE